MIFMSLIPVEHYSKEEAKTKFVECGEKSRSDVFRDFAESEGSTNKVQIIFFDDFDNVFGVVCFKRVYDKKNKYEFYSWHITNKQAIKTEV